MQKIGAFLFSGILLIFVNLIYSQDINISASVDKNPVGVEEQFTYQVKVSGSKQNLPDVELPDFGNFAILGGPSVSTSFQIINFNMTASKTYSLVLMPKKTGTFSIAPASIKYDGAVHKSNSIEVTVQKQAGNSQQTPGSQGRLPDNSNVDISDLVFLQVIPSQKKAYVNEEVTLRYKLYFRTQITNNEVSKLPEAVGCWVEEYPTPQRPKVYQETVRGNRYNVAEIRKVAIFPSRAGSITISPLDLIVETVIRRRQPRDLFEEFFNDPFGQTVKKSVSSGPVKIEVLPLPSSGKPENFSGLVGDYTIHSSLDKDVTETNEAISYKVKISGAGLLKSLNQLPVKFPPDFEVYDPKINESLNKSGARITGSKEFEYILIPRIPGEFKIAEMNLSFFNPEDRRYHQLNVPEYVVQVTKGKDVAAGIGSGTGLSKEEIQLLGRDIRFIEEVPGNFHPVGEMPYQVWWFYLALLFPLVVLGVAFAYRNHLEKMSTNVQYARRRKATRQAQKRLKDAKNLWKQEKAAEFYGAVSRALVGYIADKTNQPAAGLLREEVTKLLKSSKADPELENEFLKCLDEADYRRFAPGQSGDAEMQAFYQRAEAILTRLEKYF